MSQSHPGDRRGLRLVLLVLAIVTLAILAWLAFTTFFPTWIGWRSFNYVVDSIVDASGWNRNLVRAVAILLLLPFVWAVSEVIRIGLGSRLKDAWRGHHSVLHRKRAAAIVLVLYVSGFFAVTYLAGREANFAFSSGEARRFYAVTPEGIRTFPEDGNDPKYGIKLQPITPDIVESIERARRGLRPEPVPRERIPTLEFFNGNTGQPRIWYLQTPDGQYDLFYSAGFHLALGLPLRPVTTDVVQAVRRQVADARAGADRRAAEDAATRVATEEAVRLAADRRAREEAAAHLAAEQTARRQRYLGGRSPTGSWLAVSREGIPDSRIAARLVPVFSEASLFADAFVSDGVADRLARGETAVLDDLNLRDASRVVLVQVRSQTTRSVVGGQGVLRTDVTLVVRVLQPATGNVELLEAVGTGAGLDAAAAEAQALDRAIGNLRNRITTAKNIGHPWLWTAHAYGAIDRPDHR